MGGTPPGHIIPAAGLLFVALWVLLFEVRLRNSSWTRGRGLRVGALMQLVGAGVGFAAEVINGMHFDRPFQAKEHITMYALFGFSGVVFLLEARDVLPLETWRAALALANAGVALLFYVHSQMQMMEEHNALESFVHWLLALACFVTALGFAGSWAVPYVRVGMTYVGTGAQALQAQWFFFLAYALYSGDYGKMGEELEMGDATAFFVWFTLLSALLCVLVETRYALSIRPPPGSNEGQHVPMAYSKLDKNGFAENGSNEDSVA